MQYIAICTDFLLPVQEYYVGSYCGAKKQGVKTLHLVLHGYLLYYIILLFYLVNIC